MRKSFDELWILMKLKCEFYDSNFSFFFVVQFRLLLRKSRDILAVQLILYGIGTKKERKNKLCLGVFPSVPLLNFLYCTFLFEFVVWGKFFTLRFVKCILSGFTVISFSTCILSRSFLSIVEVINFETNDSAGVMFLKSESLYSNNIDKY